jgi:RecA/RadA recombinase
MATITKPFDPSKFTKSITKSIKGISTGFNDPDTWISTGNYALNKRISGNFEYGIPLGKITMFAGESGCLPETAKVKAKIVVDDEEASDVISVMRLKFLMKDGITTYLDTPDGWQRVTEWFDKGVLPMVNVSTASHSTLCATNHMIQLADENWVPAENLKVGDTVITLSGEEVVTNVEKADDQHCYDFTIDHPNHRYWGDGFSSHNSGKSFICSGSIVKHAQEQGIFCVLIDSENALDESWLKAVGVDTSPDKIMRISASLIDDVAKIISDFVEAYKTDYLDVPKEDRPKVLFVIDSLGMLLTPVEIAQFEAGDMKGDMGRKAKQLKALVTNVTNMIGNLNIGIIMTNHTYASQNMFDSTPTISGGSGIIFASSIVVMMGKLKLKKDEDGNKTTDVQGIRAMCQVAKTRYAKPFEKIELEIPYSTGLDPYSGLFDYCLSKSVLTRTGNKYIYVDQNKNEHKYYEKEYRRNENGILDLIMSEWSDVFEENEQILDLDSELEVQGEQK